MRIHTLTLLFLAASLGAGAATVPAGRPVREAALRTPASRFRGKTPVKLHQATGELVSFSAGSLTMLHARGRTKSRMVFYLTPKTKKEGTFLKGERIVVYYHVVNGRREIERIRRSPARKHRRKSSTPKSQQ